MSQPSTIHLERTTPQTARITFANPPVNLMVPEAVVRLHEIVCGFDEDPDIQVVVFSSEVPDFFINHFDGAAAGNLPVPQHEDDPPVWTDMVLRLSKASYVSIAAIRGRTRGAGNELALACDLRYASREKAVFGQPEVGIGIVPGGGGTERLPDPSAATGRSRPFSAASTTTPTWPSAGGGSHEPWCRNISVPCEISRSLRSAWRFVLPIPDSGFSLGAGRDIATPLPAPQGQDPGQTTAG